MPLKALTTSVIICAYTEKRWSDLVAAVASVEAQTAPADEIILVIDHNKTLFERAQAKFAGVTVIENQQPRGLSGARNSGIALTTGDIIAFMDEDAVAAADWLERLCEPYANPNVMGVGGRIEPLWDGGQPAWFPSEFNWVVGCTYVGMPTETAPVRNLIGCNMSFRREVFRGVGAFRNGVGRIDTVPVGCEETELCIRARQRWPKQQMMYEPRAAVQHKVPAVRGRWLYFRQRCYAEGLSKAQVASFVGAKDGLSNERTYTLKTLPHGVWRGLVDGIHLQPGGFGRAAAIVAGLGLTTFGYLRGRVRGLFKPTLSQPLALDNLPEAGN